MNNYDKDKFNEILKNEARNINIDVPDKIKNNILKTLEDLPDRELKRKNKLKSLSGLAAGIIVCMLTFNIFMPAYAESLPIIGITFKSINEAIGIGDKYVKGSKDVNITKKYEDTTMTIKNLYYDGVELAIAYELKSESGFDEKPIIFPIIKSGFQKIEYTNEENDGEFIADNTYVGLASYTFTENELSDKAKIEFIVNDLYGNWVGYYPKKLTYKIELDAKNMGKETYKINKEINFDNRIYKVKEVITSKLNTIIYGDILINNTLDSSTENYGSGREDNQLRFFAMDNMGMTLDMGALSLRRNMNFNKSLIANSTIRYSGASEEAKSITLIPYIDIFEGRKSIRGKLNEEKVIKLQTGEEYIINNVDFKEDKTTISIKANKYLNSTKNLNIHFWGADKDGEDKEENLNDSSIEEWTKGKNEVKIEDIKFNGIDDGYNFTLTLPALDDNKEYYYLISNPNIKILENEKITINLEK
ncbi:MAG: DUF4179 domain-containing protein [Clostridium sp.]|uniref:DUF4179 domain-containing protein n=1 Tax=Clostridium sp. TaxID=1506 RepID=UPI0025C07ADD|nr:DUF4179 domain-containing protein [Clostridium sp.]MCF0147762.1 DUF4179 domain-containing protein [Clostridium sp.]